MASENKEIGSIVKKCKILLLDIEGTTTSISFVKDKLFPYAEENVKQFLDSQWEKQDVKEAVSALRKLALEEQKGSVEGVVAIPGEDASKEDQIAGVVGSVKWQMAADRKAGPLKQLQGLIWKQGYDNGDIKGHVYDDVSAALEHWRSVAGRKVYIYSSGSVQAQKLLFGQSQAGDLLPHIEGHFDTAVGAKQEADSYINIVKKIGCKAEEILFLTDIVKEAEAARTAGMHAALVSREGNAPLPAEATRAFTVLHSLAELTATNKRKPEPQDEQPAKVPKTDVVDDVKTTSSDVKPVETVTKESEPEKMEVEEEAVKVEEAVTSTEAPKAESVEKIVVEEITDSNEAAGVPVTNIEPVIEEKVEEKEAKTEKKETEKMEIEDGAKVETKNKRGKNDEKNGEVSSPVAEETPPKIITEIEEITDKQLDDVVEGIEDLVPVVEEPATVEDMEELQNVGEVLDKECDEILSKVQDVTNLDSIPVKPLLTPIAEDTMETENLDTNDIVERILDSELELEMKQCADIDLNTVAEITDEAKTEVVEESIVAKDENGPTTATDVPVVNATENNVEAICVSEKVEENSPMDTKEEAIVNEVPKPESKEPVEVSSATETETAAKPKENDIAEVVQSAPEEVKPVVDEPKPVAEEVKPAEKAKSVEDEVKTITEEAKPTVEEVKPIEEVTPMVEDVTPVTEEGKPPAEENKAESDVKESQVNGKTTNGDAETVVNGDDRKDDELSSRLSVENGKEVVNGSNGDSMDAEKGQGDNKVEAEVAEIKVKSVTTGEPRTDPIEQPTEA